MNGEAFMRPHRFFLVVFLFCLATSTSVAATARQQTGEPEVIRVGSHAQASKLVHKVMPVYSPAAKEAGIQGTVTLCALIGKNGRVEALKYISGPPLLVQTALEAVRWWEYKPTLLNGKPVKVKTEIDVVFSLGHPNKPKPESRNTTPGSPGTSPQPCEPQYRGPEGIRVGGHVQAAKLTHRVTPVYPPEAKEQVIQEKVVFHAIIGKEGYVKKLEAVSGEPMLAKAAEAAVRQWIYKPTEIRGRRVEVQTKITVIFTLGGSGAAKLKSKGH
jgi:TonB family protein